MTTEQGLEWPALAALLLALTGALRWDLLRLWGRDLLKARPPLITPQPTGKLPQAPTHLHAAETAQRPMPNKPAFHRSGRRG